MDFKKVFKDIPILGQVCPALNSAKDDDYEQISKLLHSSLLKWENLLISSATQDKEGSSKRFTRDIIAKELSCDDSGEKVSFDAINRTTRRASDALLAKTNAYLITDLLIECALNTNEMTSQDQSVYREFKTYANKYIGSPSILNNPRCASMALLAWNNMATVHMFEIKKNIYELKIQKINDKSKDRTDLLSKISSSMDQVCREESGQTGGKGKKKRKSRRKKSRSRSGSKSSKGKKRRRRRSSKK